LSDNNKGIHIDWEGFMKCAAEMGSGVMIYIPSFINIGSGIQKLNGGVHRHTHSMVISKPTVIFMK
jgi:hypothetical protein